MFPELAFEGAAGDTEVAAHRADADGILHSVRQVGHGPAKHGVVDREVVGGVTKHDPAGRHQPRFAGFGDLAVDEPLHGFPGSFADRVPRDRNAGKHGVGEAADEVIVVGANN